MASKEPHHPYGLHWFRRDLRVAGNPGLRWSSGQHHGRVLGIFCFDARFLARPDFSVDRFAFFLETLRALRDDLRAAGGDLLVMDDGPAPAFARLMETLDTHGVPRPATMSFCRDYEPFARARDAELTALLEQRFGVLVHSERDHLLIEPDELRKDPAGSQSAAFYQVYTPFARRWFELLATPKIQARIALQREGLAYLEKRQEGKDQPPLFALTWTGLFGGRLPLADYLPQFMVENARRVRVPIPPAGSLAAFTRLAWFAGRLGEYKDERERPAVDGTSQMSRFLKNGSITSAQIIATLKLGDAAFAAGTGRSSFLRELCWREFYYHVLWHRPDVETQAFLPQFRDLPWQNRADWFDAWKEGRTGYPIVDAGMRQLVETGWMHNRVRMIVASFLTKDLLIDWRWGEKFFMERLLDGDLASNNGGWQWAASTGCDPQPYFRIFNPTLQSERFDPDGAYVQRFLPDRRALKGAAVHEPRQPIVDHATQKEKALAMYKAASTRGSGTPP